MNSIDFQLNSNSNMHAMIDRKRFFPWLVFVVVLSVSGFVLCMSELIRLQKILVELQQENIKLKEKL